jgi:hypothetical protein
MSNDLIASSAVSAPFAEDSQQADEGAVRWLSGARSPEGGRGGTAAAGARQEEGPAGASSALPMPFEDVIQAAEQTAVRPLLGAASPEPALSGTGFTYRHNWGRRRGQWTLRLNLGGVNPRSRVLASIGEGAAGGPDAGKFIGAARYTLHNVAPRAGGVDIWVNVEWGSDILLYVDYLVVNP